MATGHVEGPRFDPATLDAVIKAYDVRGVVPDQFDAELARAVGAAMVEVLDVRASEGGPGSVVVGQDMRPSGDDLVAAFAEGVVSRGCDVVRIGLASTDGLYYASGALGLPGAMFTASHNPARYNGIKLCRVEAAPVGQESGLRDIRRLVEEGLPAYDGPRGTIRSEDMLGRYAQFLRDLVDLRGMRPLRVVVDAGNGMAGLTVPAVLGTQEGLPPLPVEVIPLYFDLDGTFPHHEANPIEPENLRDLQAAVVREGADLGLAFDGDADRCFVVDETGAAVTPSAITALIAARELARHPGATIIYNCISSRTVPEVIAENGGVGVRTRVGHSFIKARMAETGAVFGGEHSGHFYFTDFWRADSGMLAALHVMAALGETEAGVTLSTLIAPYDRYVVSGEINSEVADVAAATRLVRDAFGTRPGVATDDLDGLTVSADEWWFNLRPSNTEPLLRLNVEAVDAGTMASVRDEVLALVRGVSS
ncbi:MAG: phosphomannomutase/phosphoglucomutase [Candidatus Nanopelagicales bacterium]